ncbi:MAG: hypothetical protein AB1554_00685 [Chloroflexota bacterium]
MRRLFPIIPVFLFVFLSACADITVTPPSTWWTDAMGTLTATLWTPTPVTPSATPVPNPLVVLDALNSVLRGADPLGEAMDAKLYVTDVGFDANGNPPVIITLRISVECEWVMHPSCTTERAFVQVIHALEKEGVRKKIVEHMPASVEFIQVVAFDHFNQSGTLIVRWQDVLAYIDGKISPEQLAAYVLPFSP